MVKPQQRTSAVAFALVCVLALSYWSTGCSIYGQALSKLCFFQYSQCLTGPFRVKCANQSVALHSVVCHTGSRRLVQAFYHECTQPNVKKHWQLPITLHTQLPFASECCVKECIPQSWVLPLHTVSSTNTFMLQHQCLWTQVRALQWCA